MRFFFRFIATVLSLCGAASGLHAQVPPPHPASLRFLFLDESNEAYFVKLGRETYRQVSSAPYAISPAVEPTDFEPLGIYKRLPGPDAAAGKPTYLKIASVTPSATSTSTLVVLASQAPSTPAGPPNFQVTEFDISPRDFPTGSVRVINLGRTAMAVQLGRATPRLVSAGATAVIPTTPDAQDRVPARIAVQEGSNWRILSNKILILRPAQRITGVFVYSPSGMRHTYTREEIAEFGPPKPGHFWLTFTDTLPAPPSQS